MSSRAEIRGQTNIVGKSERRRREGAALAVSSCGLGSVQVPRGRSGIGRGSWRSKGDDCARGAAKGQRRIAVYCADCLPAGAGRATPVQPLLPAESRSHTARSLQHQRAMRPAAKRHMPCTSGTQIRDNKHSILAIETPGRCSRNRDSFAEDTPTLVTRRIARSSRARESPPRLSRCHSPPPHGLGGLVGGGGSERGREAREKEGL